MIICPKCQHQNLDGTMFCSECGTQLVGKDPLTTQSISAEQIAQTPSPAPVAPRTFRNGNVDAWGSLHLLDTGQILPLTGRNEFTLGRISEGQPIMPDIDLSPYQAYASGVSRLHAVVKRQDQRIILMDLGSANGTYVNGRRLTANVEHTLTHGDIVAFGKLKIQVLLKT